MGCAPTGDRPPAEFGGLTDKEKQTLRLMVRGYDAKSMARHLGLSVHTVNERLRDARRKLGVSSSREAARLLFETEADDPQILADKEIGGAASADAAQDAASGKGPAQNNAVGIITGVVVMSIFAGILAVSLLPEAPPPAAQSAVPAPAEAAAPLAVRDSEAVRAARAWLVLGDEARWKDGWLATASSFRKSNTVEQWAEVAAKVRGPLGAVISRTALSQESIPAPPSGVEVVKFRTSFANRASVIETVSLAREGSDWKVVGIYID